MSLEVVPLAGGEPRVLMTVRNPATDVAPVSPYLCAWSADGGAVYFVGQDPKERAIGIWRVPAAGGHYSSRCASTTPHARGTRAGSGCTAAGSTSPSATCRASVDDGDRRTAVMRAVGLRSA
jgi:hypothetical protein